MAFQTADRTQYVEQVQAVRIGCEGEVSELDVEKYQPVTLTAYDDLFQEDAAISELSRFIGLPLVARRAAIDKYFRIDYSNPEASYLFRNCDIGAFDNGRIAFGQIPERWAVEVGPVVIARLDRKPLHPLHAAAVAAFCSRYLRQSFQDCIESERVWRSQLATREYVYEQRRKVLAETTAQKFAEFFELYKHRRILGVQALKTEWNESFDDLRRMGRWSVPQYEIDPRPEWNDVPSPFEL